MAWNWSWFSVALIVIFGVVIALLDIVPIEDEKNGNGIVLGDTRYDVEVIQAPAATGTLLSIISWVLTKSPLGPLINRILLRGNNLHVIRKLSSQMPERPPLYFPLQRLNTEEYQEEMKRVKKAVEERLDMDSVYKHGLPFERDIDSHIHSKVHKLNKMYVTGEITPMDIVEKTISANEKLKRFKIFASLNETDVRDQARASTKRWREKKPLSIFDGVPVAVKDMINIKGYIVTDGSESSKSDIPAEKDDTIVERFRKAGAIIIGLTTMTEGGVTPLGYTLAYRGPFNPWNASFYSGGSSSGSAVAVALGICPVAVGFDGGGSIRIPSAMSGVYGLAVTFGRIPFERVTPSTMIKSGPIAISSADAALAYTLMAGKLPHDHFYARLYDGGVKGGGPPPAHLANFHDVSDLSDVRLGIFPEYFQDASDSVVKACTHAIDTLKQMGVTVVEVKIPHLQWMRLAHGLKIASEFAQTWDLKYHTVSSLEANTRITVSIGSTVSALEILAAERLRSYAFDYMRDIFSNHNLTAFVTPTTPISAPRLTDEAQIFGESNSPLVLDIMKFIFLANFVGMPGMSVPVGHDETNSELPIALHLLGNHWQEAKLLRISNALEQKLNFAARKPKERIEIF